MSVKKIRKPSEETIIRFTKWIEHNWDDDNREKFVCEKQCVISDPDATTGLLLSLRRDKIIPKIASEAIKRGVVNINAENPVWSSNFLTLNGISYQTKLVTGVLVALSVAFGDALIYQGSPENPLLVITNSRGEIGLVAPLIPPEIEASASCTKGEYEK